VPYEIDVETAADAADNLCQAIYAAAHEVDKKITPTYAQDQPGADRRRHST
jgi:hypothetical protein